MRVLFDSSVLIAGMFTPHAAHSESRSWLEAAKSRTIEFVVAGHSLAETYAVFSAYPVRPPIRPADVWRLIEENVLTAAEVVALTAADYQSVVRRLAQAVLSGGVIYDALIAEAATLARADRLLTLNHRDFSRVWPGAAGRVLSPLSSSPPAPDAD
jgi:predicted nucleic acid-binding protein